MNIVPKPTIVGNFKVLKSFVIVFLMLSASAVAYAKPLLALIATNKNLTKLTDAAMAELSGKNILLVERNRIDEVIKEQKFSAAGLVNANSLIRTGAILKADIIVVFTEDFGNTRFIAFDVKTGIRLQDRFLADVDFEAKLNWTVSAVLKAIKKYQFITTKNVTLFSFLPINLILLNQNEIASARMTEMLLKQDLLENENYLILERDQVDALVNERIINQSALKNLLPGSYIAELEVRRKNAPGRVLTANLILKKNRIEKIDPIKATYHVEPEKGVVTTEKIKAIKVEYKAGMEKEAALEMSKELNQLLKVSKINSASNRKAEALAYLKDSRMALKNFDSEKSISSAKNAYLLDPSLKIQINELLEKNYYYLSDQTKGWNKTKKGTEKYKKLLSISRLALDLMAFYKTVNGQPMKYWILGFSRVLPIERQHEIKQAYDEYFSDWLAIIKQKYDYKKKTPGTFEYLSTYKDYIKRLSELANTDWTCVHWIKYIEPEALRYLGEVEDFYKKHPHSEKLSSIVESCAVLPRHGFHSQNNEFDAVAFDKNSKILQHMLDSSIISWKIFALKDLYNMIYYYNTYRRFSVNFDPNSKYAVAFVRKIYKSPLVQRIGSPEKRYKIFNSFFDNAAESPNYIKNNIADYFYTSIHGRLMQKTKNKQLDPVYVKAVKAKIPMKKLMRDFSYDQLIQLKKAAENIDNPEFKKLLDRYIGYKAKKSKPECKTGEYLSSRQKKIVIKEIFYKNSRGVKYRSFFFPTKAVREKNYVYLPLYTNDYHFTLVKIDLGKNGEATVGRIKKYNADLSFSRWPKTCIGPKNIFLISPDSVIVYPKNGTLPEVIKVQTMINTKIQSACFLNGKIYACISKTDEKKLPTEIIELNPASKTTKIIFSEKQTVNNPFRSPYYNMKIEGEILADTKKNCLTMAVRNITTNPSSPYDKTSSSWSFFPGTGKWENNGKIKRYIDIPETDFKKVNKQFWIAISKYSLNLVDLSKQISYINNFTETLGLNAEKHKEFSTLQIRLEKAGKKLYLGNCVSCGTNLYQENGIIFLKPKKIVKLDNEKVLLPFSTGKKQCYLSCKYYSDRKLDLELWLNTVNEDIANSNDFKIIASVLPERGLSPQKSKKTFKTDSKECKSTLHKSKYEDPNFTNEYLAINVPSGLPEDFYYPAGVFVEKNIIFIPNYSRSFKHFYLIRIDLANDLETTFSQLGELKTKKGYNGSGPLTCIGDENLFMVSSNGVIVSYPKNGNKPQIFTVKELKQITMDAACFLNGKIYVFFRASERAGQPCRIAEFDPDKNTFKYIYYDNQAENNPFKNLKSFGLTSNFFADKANKCIIMLARGNGFWRFFPANGKWQKIELKNHTSYSNLNGRIINNTFFTLADNNSMEVFDISKDKKDINSLSREVGLKPKQYADYSAIKFSLKYSGKPVYIKTSILDNDNNFLSGWNNLKVLKYCISISPPSRLIASFKWGGKQHFLFVKFTQTQKKGLNYGFLVYTINPSIKRGNSFKIVDLNR